MSLLASFEQHVAARPYKPFLVLYQGERFKILSYLDLMDGARRWASAYRAQGVPPRSVVVIVLKQSTDLYTSFLGAMLAGLLPSYLPFPTPKQDPKLYWQAHATLFERIRPAVAVTYAENAAALDGIAAPVGCPVIVADAQGEQRADDGVPNVLPRQDELALLQHSSGTTGLKKGVMLTYGQIERHLTAYGRSVQFGMDDIVASWLPLYHDMGLITSFLMPLQFGASVVAMDPFEWVGEPMSILKLIERHKANYSWQPNFALAHMARTRPADFAVDLSSMKAFISTSEPCKPETFAHFMATFEPNGLRPEQVITSYGMAENVFASTQGEYGVPARPLYVDREILRTRRRAVPVARTGAGAEGFMSCGKPIDGLEIKIKPAPEDAERGDSDGVVVGEVCIRATFLFDGYYKNVDATMGAFDKDGWYHSGDIGFLLDGEIFICGRKKEMLVIHGRNFYANDIEHAINQVPGVKPGRCVAFALYDGETGSEEAVVIVESEISDAIGVRDLKRLVKKAVYDVLELSLRKVEVMPPGWLVKSTAGKTSRSENIKKFVGSRS